MKKIIITLKRGVIEVVSCDPEIDLEIRDYDIYDEELQNCEIDEEGKLYINLY